MDLNERGLGSLGRALGELDKVVVASHLMFRPRHDVARTGMDADGQVGQPSSGLAIPDPEAVEHAVQV